MPEPEQKSFQRQVAYKARISDILNHILIKDNISAGYIKLNNAKISRVNIIATIVYKPESGGLNGALIDDSTGKIPLRVFENDELFLKFEVGDAVLAIGKIREFNGEKYILPEIIKKINNPQWFNVRKLESCSNEGSEEHDSKDDAIAEEAAIVNNQEIYSLIKNLDVGNGASVDEVIKNSNNGDAENIILRMVESGDVFEVSPGRVKVLE